MRKITAILLTMVLLLLCSSCQNENELFDEDDIIPKESEKETAETVSSEVFEPKAKYAFEIDATGGIYISGKYDDTRDIQYYLCQHSVNNLFDFQQAWVISNKNQSPRIHRAKEADRVLWGNGDWHAPFQIDAINHGDGDSEGVFFTGGVHGYKNISADASPTATCLRIEFFADGNEIKIRDKGYADEITICWENLVQASNTMKANGSGREVLKASYTLTFKEDTFYSHTELIPLEDIKCHLWYGMQMLYQNGNDKTVWYVNGESSTSYDASVASESGDASCEMMRLVNNESGLVQEMYLNTSVGLGTRELCNEGLQRAMFSMTYGKSYCTVIDSGAILCKGETYVLEGYYKMYKQSSIADG